MNNNLYPLIKLSHTGPLQKYITWLIKHVLKHFWQPRNLMLYLTAKKYFQLKKGVSNIDKCQFKLIQSTFVQETEV